MSEPTLSDLWRDRSVEIVLRTSKTSPFGRKTRMALHVLGLADRVREEHADTLDVADSLRTQNPLGKMPCLLIDGEAFFDSHVILEMLDMVAGGDRLMPASGLSRYRALTRARLADGITDAALLMVYEGRFRDPETASARWLDHQRGKIDRALAVFEAAPPATRPDLVSITLAAALGYLDWRRPVDWRADHPRLTDWLAAFATLDAWSATERTSP